MNDNTYEIRALFDEKNIAVYAAFGDSIAIPALKNQQLLPPFVYNRMTWVKPSFLWMLYRSDWGNRASMTRILRIWIKRSHWDAALQEAILTTPVATVYPNKKKWRTQLEKTRVRVQWDPERSITNKKLAIKSIQLGITAKLSEQYAKQWITKIEEVTSMAHRINNLLLAGKVQEAEKLLPQERIYPTPAASRITLGMIQ